MGDTFAEEMALLLSRRSVPCQVVCEVLANHVAANPSLQYEVPLASGRIVASQGIYRPRSSAESEPYFMVVTYDNADNVTGLSFSWKRDQWEAEFFERLSGWHSQQVKDPQAAMRKELGG